MSRLATVVVAVTFLATLALFAFYGFVLGLAVTA